MCLSDFSTVFSMSRAGRWGSVLLPVGSKGVKFFGIDSGYGDAIPDNFIYPNSASTSFTAVAVTVKVITTDVINLHNDGTVLRTDVTI